MKSLTLVLLSLLLGLFYAQIPYQNVTVLAWNVQIFGPSKMTQNDVVAIVMNVFRRYDINLMQEIRDVSGVVIQEFFTQLNNCTHTTSPCPQFNMSISAPLGQSISKETYAFIYRGDKGIRLTHQYQYPDPDLWFQRPPFNVRFQVQSSTFVLSPCHTSPSDAVAEIDHLYDVYLNITNEDQLAKEKNVMFLGDLNAGCTYVTASKWPMIRLRNGTEFTWFLGDLEFTNLLLTCPYDRFVGNQGMKNLTFPNSAQVARVDREFGLNQTQMGAVSDHFPILITLAIPRQDVTICFGISSNDPLVCSGRGVCSAMDSCTCNSGRGGAQCQNTVVVPFSCNGILSNDPKVCSGNGTCLAQDQCFCFPGYNGTTCQTFDCWGYSALDPMVCSFNGTCVAGDTCVCNPGRTGKRCESGPEVVAPVEPLYLLFLLFIFPVLAFFLTIMIVISIVMYVRPEQRGPPGSFELQNVDI